MTVMKKFKPSNGTEGTSFIEDHCMQCIHCDPDSRGAKQCEILCATMVHDIKDKEYPKEWVYIDDKPTCTEWQKWDWKEQGDPDDPKNPNAPIQEDPQQLQLFSFTPNGSIKPNNK